MKNFAILASVGVLLAMPAFAADKYTIDPEYSMPNFEITHLGFTTQRGRFTKISGTVTLDRAAKTGSVEFTVDTGSIDMGSVAWSSHLADEGLFNVKVYPTMTYKSSKLIFNGDKVVAAEGEFTMLGVTKPLKVHVTNFQCGTHPVSRRSLCAGNITAKIHRSEFGLTKYIPEVSDEVTVTVPVEAYKD